MAAIVRFPRSRGKGRQPATVERVRDLEMEVHAAGMEMVTCANWISNALVIGDIHTAQHFAGRLGALGRSYLDPDPEAA